MHIVMQCDTMCVYVVAFFFFKQKTAYEMLRSLVGSEMCIRDRGIEKLRALAASVSLPVVAIGGICRENIRDVISAGCLLYTSDAADDLLCVDLGGRRIIKKKIEKF